MKFSCQDFSFLLTFPLMKNSSEKILFVGCGAMGEALLSSCLQKGLYSPEDVFVSESDPSKRKRIALSYGVNTVEAADPALKENTFGVVIAAVKPQQAENIIPALLNMKFAMLITILAGVRCSWFTDRLGAIPVMRAMPNMCIRVSKSVSALFANEYLKVASRGKELEEKAAKIFSASGHIISVKKEDDIDRVTAIAGSGPAYAAYFIEALAEAAESLGFGKDVAEILSLKTFEGASAYLAETGESAAELRKKVTSPGGTTEAAIKIYEANKLKETVSASCRAAWKRAGELGKNE